MHRGRSHRRHSAANRINDRRDPIRYHALVTALALVSAPAAAQQTSLTLYQDGRMFVRRTIPLAVPAGASSHRLALGSLNPESFFVLDTTIRVVRTAYDAAVDEANTMRRMVGRTLLFGRGYSGTPRADTVRVEVLGVSPELFRLADGTVLFQRPGVPLYPMEVVQTVPVLALDVESRRRTDRLPVGFFAPGASWQAGYTIVLAPGSPSASIAGQASMVAGTYAGEDIEIQLVAGSIGQAGRATFEREDRIALRAGIVAAEAPVEERIGDVHLYTLPRRYTLTPGVTTTVPLFDPARTTYEKNYTVLGQLPWRGFLPQQETEDEVPVTVTYTLARTLKTAFGDTPLPGGVARLYAADQSGRLQLIGEARFDHTAPAQPLRLQTGNAFDLTARRTQTSYRTQRDSTRTTAVADYRVALANGTDSTVTADVIERRSGEWRILASSVPAERLSATEVRFRVRVPAAGEATLTYRVRVVW